MVATGSPRRYGSQAELAPSHWRELERAGHHAGFQYLRLDHLAAAYVAYANDVAWLAVGQGFAGG